jgi:ABC-type antimicrobial peptide transport system permease subunit
MFYNLKIMLRNLRRGGIYSWINVGGLAIGMAVAILIFAWIYHEWSYDRFHTKEKQLYLAYSRGTYNGELWCGNGTSQPLGIALKTDYAEVVGVTRMINNSFLFANNDAKFNIQTSYVDPDFLTMFDFPLLRGNRETALNDPYSVILTEKAAIRLFSETDLAMGETLLFENQYSVTVTGIMKDLPSNTTFEFEVLLPMQFLTAQGKDNPNWRINSVLTFVELHPEARLASINESIRDITRPHTNERNRTETFLYPVVKRHLYSQFVNGIPVAGGLVEKMRLFGLIAGLVLMIACINFMNMSTARSAKRAKEVGVRKVIGGRRSSLIGLFIGESMLVALIAGVAALVLALMALPVFGALMEQQIMMDLTNTGFWLAWAGFILLTGLLAGSYPAFLLSSFRPVKVLKGIFNTKQTWVSPRKILVVMQFSVASALIVSTMVIYRQIRYAQDRETGYDKDQLVYIHINGDIAGKYEFIRQDLLNSGAIASVTKTMSPMTQLWWDMSNVQWRGKDTQDEILFNMFFTDADWTKTTGTTIIEGRDIDIYTYATDSSALLLNESAAKIMNLEHPVGEIINMSRRDWHVVGVVKDFIVRSPYDPVEPMLIGGPAGVLETIHIKINGHNRMSDNLAKVEQVFKQHNPAYPFEYNFVDEEYARKFQDEQTTGSLVSWFAGLTIFISCMGLFALVAFMAETRRKEIGIRKVLGASVSSVMLLLSKEFLILVVISVAIASPIAWWAMEKWLTNYAYRTNIPWWLFIVVGCLSVFIALITVGFQAIRAATANPVEAIKAE